MPLRPYFRYAPDRAVMQRLIMRAANMKDDLAEFNLDGEGCMDMDGMEGAAEDDDKIQI